MTNIHVCTDSEAIYQAVGALWKQRALAAVADKSAFHVALAGGSTPRGLYEWLAAAAERMHLPWAQTHIYFGDERCVPADHADSNYRMAAQSLLSRVPLPPAQIHAMFDPAMTAAQNASRYTALLQSNLPLTSNRQPRFDLILLGMGDDGHTASLFPDTLALDELRQPVMAQYVEQLAAWRITLTFPAINAASQVAVLVTGAGKAQRIAAIAGAPPGSSPYPVQRVRPLGQLDWYLDQAAAGRLDAVSLERWRRA